MGPGAFAVLVAEAGPAARYRAFLAARRGQVKVVIGNRAAAYAPVRDLGLVALWDDGDDLLAEPRAPYPHTRDVLALRAAAAQAAVLLAGYARTAETQTWLERGWLTELAEDRPAVRHTAPRVKVTADSDRALERDPSARAARLPHEVFETDAGRAAAGAGAGPGAAGRLPAGAGLLGLPGARRAAGSARDRPGSTEAGPALPGVHLVRPPPGRLDLPDL